ncbi:MAG: hypothetical protein HPY64_10675 [Anaerolineae bacterium]|nr:hypothetical protein [Anaerolineae bacterium]
MTQRQRLNRFWLPLMALAIVAVLTASVVLADNVQNDVVAGGNDTFTLGSSTSVNYKITANSGDGQAGCNAADTSPATVTINIPPGVTATPGSLTFTSCGNWQSVVFTASAVGDYSITVSVSDSGPGTYNTNPATFTLHVLPPPDTTPPVITPSVSGTSGNNGWYKSDVTVSWTVSDSESAISSSSGCGTTTINYDTSGVTLTCTATSAGGTSSQSVTIKRDATPPTISGAAAPAPVGGWNNTDVTVSFTCGDEMSGVASCGPNVTLSAEGAGQSVTGTAVDNAGNSASATVSGINIDKTAPVITPTVSGTSGNNGWYVSDVAVSWAYADISPVTVTGCDSTTISADTAGTTLTCTATSAGGTSSQSVTIKRDATPPTITGSRSPVANSYGWNNEDVTVSFTCTDATSGLASCTSDTTLSSEGAGQFVTGNATDNAGNSATATVSDINIDKTAPTITGSRSPAANSYGWNNEDVTVSFTCGDNLSGVASCSDPTTVSTEGENQSVTGNVTDKAGNSATATVSDINIDKTAPSITASYPAPNSNGWYNTNVTIHFACEDSLSGIVSCPADITLGAIEGSNLGASGTVADKAGNGATATVSDINIDKTAPVVSVTGVVDGATYTLGSVPVAGCSTDDALSGVATPASLESSYPGGVGTFTATCSGALDYAGNPGSASVTYRVIYDWNGFFRPVDNLPVVNRVKAGSAIPIKFSLSGYQGMSIFAARSPASGTVPCDSTAQVDLVEETVTAGGSSLNYDPLADQYIYVWKTERSWGGTCRQLVVRLNDGTEHRANFNFTR